MLSFLLDIYVAHVRAQPPAIVAGVAKGLPPIAWQNDNSKNI